MTIYLYRCRSCGHERESDRRDNPALCVCGGVSRRVFSANIGRVFTPHYNHAVGAYVSSSRQFDDLLKKRSDENSIRTGTTHNYQRVDPGDVPEPKSDTAILDTQAKSWRDRAVQE